MLITGDKVTIVDLGQLGWDSIADIKPVLQGNADSVSGCATTGHKTGEYWDLTPLEETLGVSSKMGR